jgi:hypothetical protein
MPFVWNRECIFIPLLPYLCRRRFGFKGRKLKRGARSSSFVENKEFSARGSKKNISWSPSSSFRFQIEFHFSVLWYNYNLSAFQFSRRYAFRASYLSISVSRISTEIYPYLTSRCLHGNLKTTFLLSFIDPSLSCTLWSRPLRSKIVPIISETNN